jgi:hypothetical protein
MDAWKPVVGDPSGKTPAQADELAKIRSSSEYTRAHRNYLERARNGERLTGVESFPDGHLERADSYYGRDETAAEDRNDTEIGGFAALKPSLSDALAGRGDPMWKGWTEREVDNLARREALEAYEQERARARKK